MKKEIILQVKQVSGGYYKKNFWRQNKIYREVLHDINFEIYSGEIVGLIGESGAGKSTLAKIVLGLVKQSSGEVINYTKRPQIIFQDPYSSLNPAYTIKRILEEPLRIKKCGREEREQIVHSIIKKVGLDESFFGSKPKELSGGQLQRINIAMALIQNPKFIICDEPVSSLDLATQTKILDLFSSVQKEFGISYLFISHDLNVVYKICDRVLVMKNGRIVEQGKTKDVFDNPVHEYTKQLIDFM